MTTPSERLRRVLSALASDRRRSIAYYGNAVAAPGTSAVPRRLISDFGFPTNSQFQYIVPSTAHVTINREPRENVNEVIIHPYGLENDRSRLISTVAAERRLARTRGQGVRGVALLPGSTNYYISAELDETAYLQRKTVTVVQRLINQRLGPAYHFVIARTGDILVCAALDDEVHAYPDRSATSISIALEGALAISVADWQARNYTNLIEIPFDEIQLFTLRVLYAKLKRAIPQIADNITYVFPNLTGVRQCNFTNDRPETSLDYTTSTLSDFIARSNAVGTFNLATEVFRIPEAPAPRVTRAEARTAIAEIDTTGTLSPALAAYAALASTERARDMQAMPRNRFFVHRINVAHQDADSNNAQEAQIENVANQAEPVAMVASGPHVFDFSTGFWQDEVPKTY
jgi:hypothetical protein